MILSYGRLSRPQTIHSHFSARFCASTVATPPSPDSFPRLRLHHFLGMAFSLIQFRLGEHGVSRRFEPWADEVVEKTKEGRFFLQFGLHEADATMAFGVAYPVAPGIDAVPTGQDTHAEHQRFADQAKPPMLSVDAPDEKQCAVLADNGG